MIVLHPNLYTLIPQRCTPSNPWGKVEALCARDGAIVAVGTREEILALQTKNERVIEPKAACIMPGFIDTHAHLSCLGMRPGMLDLPDDTSPQQWAQAVAQSAAQLPAGSWIVGRGWNQEVWSGEGLPRTVEGFPTHELLSQAAPHHPVLLHRIDQHAIWVNQAAMRAANFTRDAADPPGGKIIRDAGGEPSGVFVDEAGVLFEKTLPPLTSEELCLLLRENAAQFLAQGITCMHCAVVPLHELAAYHEVFGTQNTPGLRVRGMAYAKPKPLAAWARNHAPQRDPKAMWSLPALKAFADGALGSRGAWFFEPYEGETTCGMSVAPPDELEQLSRAALESGWQMAVHAIGDRAIAETLSAWERAGLTKAKAQHLCWRIEHVQHPRKESLDAMAQRGIGAAMQPIHCTQDMRFAEALLGPTRAAFAYPWHAVHSRQIPLGFGSDYPIETNNPFVGIHAAVTRQNAQNLPKEGWHRAQCVSRQTAIGAYTYEGAKLMVEDTHTLGHLGAVADWVALDTDITKAPIDKVRCTRALWVVTAGKTRHGKPGN